MIQSDIFPRIKEFSLYIQYSSKQVVKMKLQRSSPDKDEWLDFRSCSAPLLKHDSTENGCLRMYLLSMTRRCVFFAVLSQEIKMYTTTLLKFDEG